MSYTYKLMTREDANRISCWKYEEPYSIYSMDESEECIVDLINGDYICVINNNQELIGFLCTGLSARVPGGYAANIYNDADFVDFGLGMKPELTGSGLGKMFVSEGIQIISEYMKTRKLRLVVATFNTRAVKLYESAGFVKETLFLSKINDQNMEFISMTLMSSSTNR